MKSEVGTKPAKELSAAEYALVLAQEELVVDTQIAIHRLLRKRGLKQADLAGLLGVSEARVSQLFGSDARNLTLRTIARIYHVLGSACRVVERGAEDVLQESPGDAQESGDPMHWAEAALVGTNGDAGASTDNKVWARWMDKLGATTPEHAAFPSGAVWIVGGGAPIVLANENEPFRRRSAGRRLPGAEQWAEADVCYASA